MGVFDDILGDLLANFSEWIKIEDYQSKWTIEDFPYETGVDERKTKPHCWYCVAVNKCWFKNEERKKPKELNSSTLSKLSGNNGLYHKYCHCKKGAIDNPTMDDIKLIIPNGKIDKYLFVKKIEWVNYLGYSIEDKETFIKILFEKTKESFRNGNYYNENHTKYGFKININIEIPGGKLKENEIFKLTTNYMIFPNGRLKLNTPLGGWQ